MTFDNCKVLPSAVHIVIFPMTLRESGIKNYKRYRISVLI
jgi:hypothetical protein